MEKSTTKTCRYCQSEIPKKARICPNCRKKQGGVVKWVVVIIVAMLFVGALSDDSDNEPKKVQNETPEPSVADSDEQDSGEEEAEETTVFRVGETAELNGVQVTMTAFEESEGSDYLFPDDGNVFVLAEFKIVNNTDRELGISSMLSFEAYADDYALNYSLSATTLKDSQLDGSIAAGKKMKGWIGWEVPKDYESVEIQFKDNVWSSRKFVFVSEK